MPLPLEELGEGVAGLEVDGGESGPSDNEDAAANTLDPDDSGADLGRGGRIGGYDLLYVDPSAYAAGEGLVSVGTSIDLFTDGTSASALLRKERGDYERLIGTEAPAGTLARAETWTLEGLGEEAFELRVAYDSSGVRAYGTAVGFRLGRILGWVVVGTADGADVHARVEALARALERRIESVLLGDVTGEPEPLPAAEPGGGLDLAAMALGPADLPAGAAVIREEYVREGAYQREIDPGPASVGGSRLTFLENDLELFGGAFQAGSALNELSAFFSSGSAELLEVVEGQFAESAGLEASGVSFEHVPTPGLADGSLAVRTTFVTPDGVYEGFYVFVQVEGVLAVLFALGRQGEVSFDDVRPLAETVVERIAAGFSAA